MIIDCHGHYTTEPQKLHDFRKNQIAAIKDPAAQPVLASRGLQALPQDAATFQGVIDKDRERWARVVKAGNIRSDK